MVSKQEALKGSRAPRTLPEGPKLGIRPVPRTPEINSDTNEEVSISVLDLVETEATPADQPRSEAKVLEEESEISARSAEKKFHVESAASVLMKLRHVLQ